MKKFLLSAAFFLLPLHMVHGNGSINQTSDLTPVLPADTLPFTIDIEVAPFSLPTGIQGYVCAMYSGKWILLAGRTNGLHGFDNSGSNFPPNFQNTTVYVIDPKSGSSMSRDLSESGLAPAVIDCLSVVAAEFFQQGDTLYVVGGYGKVTGNPLLNETKSTLTALDLNPLLLWVKGSLSNLNGAVRQVSDPYLQVTGGDLYQANPHTPFLLTLGQNFVGNYTPGSTGLYTQQIRPFWIVDEGDTLFILPLDATTTYADYRRRDLNVVPIMRHNEPAYIALSGVFTLAGGVWTVPITIFPDGLSFEPDPTAATTFKQAMNQYYCPTASLYSTKKEEMYIVLPGGLSYGYFSGSNFETDQEIPFINQVTTIKIDAQDRCTQYLMSGEYPYLVSTGTNPGNQLLFGAEAQFFPAENISLYYNRVIQLDAITKPTVIGYIVGGIMSTLPNTNTREDSTSSPYVFTVTLTPK